MARKNSFGSLGPASYDLITAYRRENGDKATSQSFGSGVTHFLMGYWLEVERNDDDQRRWTIKVGDATMDVRLDHEGMVMGFSLSRSEPQKFSAPKEEEKKDLVPA